LGEVGLSLFRRRIPWRNGIVSIPYFEDLKDLFKMSSQRSTFSQRTIVCFFSGCVLAALVMVTQKGAGAFARDAGRWPNAAGQEPTAGNTKTPNGEKPKVITDAEIPDEDADEGELEPAAVNLDQSGTTPLIQELYQAKRKTFWST
jgi:hypothetical protein